MPVFQRRLARVTAEFVTSDLAQRRKLAAWCEGWSTDDLEWDCDVGAYRLPSPHPPVGGGPLAFVPFGKPGIIIRTLEGDALATEGDWIVRGEEGSSIPASGPSSPRRTSRSAKRF